MSKSKQHKLPTPPRGILSEMAREAGITCEGMRQRYYGGHAATVAEVARRTKERRQSERKALRKLIEALGGAS